MARLPRVLTLVGVAGGCGLGVGCMMLLLNRERDGLANKSNFVQRAVSIMKHEPQVRELMGDTIQVGKLTFTDGWSKMQPLSVQVRLPIKGERDNAHLFAYARRKNEQERLRLYKLEATFEKIANRKLVLLDRTDQEDPPPEEDEEPLVEQVARDEGQNKEPKRKMTKEDFKEQMKSWAQTPK